MSACIHQVCERITTQARRLRPVPSPPWSPSRVPSRQPCTSYVVPPGGVPGVPTMRIAMLRWWCKLQYFNDYAQTLGSRLAYGEVETKVKSLRNTVKQERLWPPPGLRQKVP